ncbi:MAG: IS1634 family transposase [Gammaproteobacteria bacterium]
MYIDISTLTKHGRTYKRVLLRESYRDNGKVKKRTIANLSACSDQEIEAIKLALGHKGNLADLGAVEDNLTLRQGDCVGAVWLVYQIACRLGIASALGGSREGKLALWQIIARVIDQGSRLSAVRFGANHAVCDVLDCEAFHEEHLYANLDWLDENQQDIEDKLLHTLHGQEKVDLFLYDVTSSYLEGKHNKLAAFGYNRDRKRGKQQVVIGLLCDPEGTPLSIEVFSGNTTDTKTFAQQVTKAAERFGAQAVTFVGDRGMIKGPQIEQLQKYEDHEFHYITAITKPQIEKLLKEDRLQLSLFDQPLGEIQLEEGLRYVLRRNPVRAEEIQQSRQEKYHSLLKLVVEQNRYLSKHRRAKPATARRKIDSKSKKLKIDEWVCVSCEGRTLSLSKDAEQLQEVEKLDGCYVLKTDLACEKASKEMVHDRYKDLALVEWAFRTSKTVQLEMRPVNVRLESRTRGHAFVVMMAYRIVKELASLWDTFDVTVQEALAELDSLCSTEVCIAQGGCFHRIPEPRELSRQLLEAADVTLPLVLPSKGIRVATKKKLPLQRKAA